MARRRQTIDVAAVLEKVNHMLALPDSEYRTADYRRGAASVLESILHATGNYKGYDLLAWANGGYAKWVADGKPASTAPYLGDETRRMYYGAPVPEDSERERRFPLALVST